MLFVLFSDCYWCCFARTEKTEQGASIVVATVKPLEKLYVHSKCDGLCTVECFVVVTVIAAIVVAAVVDAAVIHWQLLMLQPLMLMILLLLWLLLQTITNLSNRWCRQYV